MHSHVTRLNILFLNYICRLEIKTFLKLEHCNYPVICILLRFVLPLKLLKFCDNHSVISKYFLINVFCELIFLILTIQIIHWIFRKYSYAGEYFKNLNKTMKDEYIYGKFPLLNTILLYYIKSYSQLLKNVYVKNITSLSLFRFSNYVLL